MPVMRASSSLKATFQLGSYENYLARFRGPLQVGLARGFGYLLLRVHHHPVAATRSASALRLRSRGDEFSLRSWPHKSQHGPAHRNVVRIY
jgi:hypothetical protein